MTTGSESYSQVMGERIKNAANAVIRFIEGSLLAESHDQSAINVQILAEVSVAMRHLRPFGPTFKKIQKLVNTHEGGALDDPEMWDTFYSALPQIEKSLAP